ncbi:thiamine phosphate synthase [Sinimarinibacterium sp. CAU 1509]|uniref:thiamine phosphate synthase n=1 Tax=Sinimarinibacterium sp. CAU 1509 TaxID=2562283 RepID=UPI0010AB8A41|nr:thiamine phosphate synthase [Sinimarinibacterium sp. CAU 1509]TJY58969.1 thiamine phosphate synthase [Sinimarinibacterium sp. CAU 1509]
MPLSTPPWRDLKGLYAISSETIVRDPAHLLPAVTAAIRGGVTLVQYRDKWNPADVRHQLAAALAQRCHDLGARLIINDDPALAAAVGADGVHVGVSDTAVASARQQLGANAIIGATCGNSLDRAQRAVTEGADYVAFGRLFASRTKPDAPPAQLQTLSAARRLGVAVCAIGGIGPEHVPQVADAGADLIAAVDGIFGSADVEARCRRYLAALRDLR